MQLHRRSEEMMKGKQKEGNDISYGLTKHAAEMLFHVKYFDAFKICIFDIIASSKNSPSHY